MAVRQRPESLEQMQPEQLCKIKKNHILAETDYVKIQHTSKTNFHTDVEGKKITKKVEIQGIRGQIRRGQRGESTTESRRY